MGLYCSSYHAKKCFVYCRLSVLNLKLKRQWVRKPAMHTVSHLPCLAPSWGKGIKKPSSGKMRVCVGRANKRKPRKGERKRNLPKDVQSLRGRKVPLFSILLSWLQALHKSFHGLLFFPASGRQGTSISYSDANIPKSYQTRKTSGTGSPAYYRSSDWPTTVVAFGLLP